MHICIYILIYRYIALSLIELSSNDAAYWGEKTKGELGFSKTSPKAVINSLIQNCYFNVGSVTMKRSETLYLERNSRTFSQ